MENNAFVKKLCSSRSKIKVLPFQLPLINEISALDLQIMSLQNTSLNFSQQDPSTNNNLFCCWYEIHNFFVTFMVLQELFKSKHFIYAFTAVRVQFAVQECE